MIDEKAIIRECLKARADHEGDRLQDAIMRDAMDAVIDIIRKAPRLNIDKVVKDAHDYRVRCEQLTKERDRLQAELVKTRTNYDEELRAERHHSKALERLLKDAV